MLHTGLEFSILKFKFNLLIASYIFFIKIQNLKTVLNFKNLKFNNLKLKNILYFNTFILNFLIL